MVTITATAWNGWTRIRATRSGLDSRGSWGSTDLYEVRLYTGLSNDELAGALESPLGEACLLLLTALQRRQEQVHRDVLGSVGEQAPNEHTQATPIPEALHEEDGL